MQQLDVEECKRTEVEALTVARGMGGQRPSLACLALATLGKAPFYSGQRPDLPTYLHTCPCTSHLLLHGRFRRVKPNIVHMEGAHLQLILYAVRSAWQFDLLKHG